MKQAMNKYLAQVGCAALVLVTSLFPSSALGQGRGLRLEVPYGFTFASKTLPAGTYNFTFQGSRLTVTSSDTGPLSQSIISRLEERNTLFPGGLLIFDQTGKELVLSEVWIPGVEGLLLHSIPKGDTRKVLSAPSLDENRLYSGKAVFEKTCAGCHGPEGNGFKDADKFFGTSIPRLTSTQVQQKTDDELRKQILEGNEKMPPVEINEEGFMHRLSPKNVDAVIAYVRTLKMK